MPPDLEALKPAGADAYHFREREIPVREVDYVAEFLVTESLDEMDIDAPEA